MRKSKRIYFHKEDVWGQGDHWMSSASRDIFEHFYKSIKSTFLNQFKDKTYKELTEKIQNVRKWETQLFKCYGDAADKKDLNVVVPIYEEKCVPIQEEKEYDDDGVVPIDQMAFDPLIYKNFNSFFHNADHGFIKDMEGKRTCYTLYRNFIKNFSEKDLRLQLDEELVEAKKWQKQLEASLIKYVNQNTSLKWHQFLSENIDDLDEIKQ